MPRAFWRRCEATTLGRYSPGIESHMQQIFSLYFSIQNFYKKNISQFSALIPKEGGRSELGINGPTDPRINCYESFKIFLVLEPDCTNQSRTYQAVRGSLNSIEKMKILLNRSFIPSEFFPFRIQHFIAHHIIWSSQF